MLKYIDSHAHYDDSAFDDDRDIILPKIHDGGVMNIINIGCSEESSDSSMKLAEKYDFMYFAAGIHPENAENVSENYEEKIIELSKHEKCKAIGEIGLDYHYDGINKDKQKELFERQLILAQKVNKPVVIHSRDAVEDTLVLLKKYKPKGVVHCFSGSPETAKEIINIGMYIGFTGVLTFKNAKKAVKSAEIIPLDRILLETDCPYMAPEPYRGTRCDSSMIVKVIEKLAQIKGVTPESAAMQTVINTRTLFNLEEK